MGQLLAMRSRALDHCYLCSDSIDAADRTVDHVPPKSLFPESLRRQRNFDRLTTLPAHRRCNSAFAKDEQYFLHALGLLARTDAGTHIAERLINSVQDGRQLGLHRRIDREFSRDAAGRLRKTFDYERIYRVAHKIVRGLWAAAPGGHYLPPEWPCEFRLFDRDNPPPPLLAKALAEEKHWYDYPDIFQFVALRSMDATQAFFGLIFWEWTLITARIRVQHFAPEILPQRSRARRVEPNEPRPAKRQHRTISPVEFRGAIPMTDGRDLPCPFCLRQARLQRSHIVPEFFYEYDELHRHLEVAGGGKRPVFKQKGTRKHILCRDCEQYFNDHFDRPMKRQWIDRRPIPEVLSPVAITIEGLDYASFKLFHLSVLWRASVARHQRVNLGRHEESVRKMLQSRDPGPPERYPLVAVALRLPDNTPARGVVFLPARSRIGAHTVYSSVFGGCHWIHVIASHALPREIQPHALTRTGAMTALVEELRSVKEIEVLMRRYEENRIKQGWPEPWPK